MVRLFADYQHKIESISHGMYLTPFTIQISYTNYSNFKKASILPTFN